MTPAEQEAISKQLRFCARVGQWEAALWLWFSVWCRDEDEARTLLHLYNPWDEPAYAQWYDDDGAQTHYRIMAEAKRAFKKAPRATHR